MNGVKEIDQGRIPSLQDLDLYGFHEPAHGQPKIVPHHDDTLQAPAVAVPHGLHQLAVLFISLGMEPLLELVQHQQHLLARPQESTLRTAPGVNQTEMARQSATCRRKPLSKRASVSAAVASMYTAVTDFANRGNKPAFINDDLPHPEGP